MQGVILAAGKGTRLYPITHTRSKAMLPVVGKPMVERVADDLWRAGIRDLTLVIRPDDAEIVEFFQKQSVFRGELHLVVQQEGQGMAKALQPAAPFIHEDFILSACDNLVPPGHVEAMVSAWQGHPGLDGILTLMKLDSKLISSSGIVALNGDYITRIVEKPAISEAPSNIGSLPLYLFSSHLIEYLSRVKPSPRGEYELQDAVQMAIDRGGRMKGLYVPWRLTVTSPEDLRTVNMRYLERMDGVKTTCPDIAAGHIQFHPPVFIEEGVTPGSGSSIGPNVYLERGCLVGKNVHLKDSVVLRGGRVLDGESLVGQIIYSRD